MEKGKDILELHGLAKNQVNFSYLAHFLNSHLRLRHFLALLSNSRRHFLTPLLDKILNFIHCPYCRIVKVALFILKCSCQFKFLHFGDIDNGVIIKVILTDCFKQLFKISIRFAFVFLFILFTIYFVVYTFALIIAFLITFVFAFITVLGVFNPRFFLTRILICLTTCI